VTVNKKTEEESLSKNCPLFKKGLQKTYKIKNIRTTEEIKHLHHNKFGYNDHLFQALCVLNLCSKFDFKAIQFKV